MGGGIVIPAVQDIEVAYSVAANIFATVKASINGNPTLSVSSQGPWRPPQWSGQALTVLTQGSLKYVFDAVFLASHRSVLTTTQNPVLTGANIVDHAYLQPKQVILEIGMSDAMDRYAPDMWAGYQSKSVSAYQTLLAMQQGRALLTLTSRLETITNMLVVDVSARDDVTTLHGLRATITLQQIIMATSSSAPSANSARPQDTGQTQNGTVQPTAPGNAVLQQFQVPTVGADGSAPSGAQINTGTDQGIVSGAGSWSSNNVASLTQ